MSSEQQLTPCQEAVSQFLAKYADPATPKQYKHLARLSRYACEDILEEIDVRGIVTDRAKKFPSLKKKMEDMALRDESFISWVEDGHAIDQYKEMGDLAAIRIGVYLPGDIEKVDNVIRKHFNIVHDFGSVPSSRAIAGQHVTQERNTDINRHNDGPWRSNGPGGIEEHWQHQGYKPWQMVVEWKTRPESVPSHRFGIEIGTVVSQAWDEVQRYIIDKPPEDLVITPSMRRMIDTANGLTSTTEILLNELDHLVQDAKEKAEVARQK